MGMRLYEGMSLREITEYLFCEDELTPSDLILVFGGRSLERADRAAELYKAGLAPRIFISGGDKRETGSPEAEILKRRCVEQGVPEDSILTESESVNTLENVKYSVAAIDKQIGWQSIRSVILVSAPHHMRRVKNTMAHHVPGSVSLLCCPDTRTEITRENWWHTPEGQNKVYRELEKVRTYAVQGEV